MVKLFGTLHDQIDQKSKSNTKKNRENYPIHNKCKYFHISAKTAQTGRRQKFDSPVCCKRDSKFPAIVNCGFMNKVQV